MQALSWREPRPEYEHLPPSGRAEIEEAFYAEVGRLLDANHVYVKFPSRYKSRWNNRAPGNGRFPGHGLVRMFGPAVIHVSLYAPRLNAQFTSAEAAIAAIALAMEGVRQGG